jgi:hypothetical protein
MSDETLRWKLFPFSLTGEAKRWYKLHIGSSHGDWKALHSSFCLQFFPIYKVIKLHLEILSFKQQKKESLGKAWECFNTILDSGPNLALPDPILLQHFFMGLNRKTTKHLNTTTRGSFMHITTEQGRNILMKILDDLPEDREKLLEEEPQIAEPEVLPEPSKPLAIPDPEAPEEEETLISYFMLEFEDELFDEHGNTSNYHMMRKPQESRNPPSIKSLDPFEEDFFKKKMKELVSVFSNEWLEESELSPKIIHLDSPSVTIECQLVKAPFDSFYNPIVGVNIMSATFAQDLLKDMPLAPTTKLLKSLSGHIVPSLGILCALPIFVNETQVLLNSYIFDVMEFDLLIWNLIC